MMMIISDISIPPFIRPCLPDVHLFLNIFFSSCLVITKVSSWDSPILVTDQPVVSPFRSMLSSLAIAEPSQSWLYPVIRNAINTIVPSGSGLTKSLLIVSLTPPNGSVLKFSSFAVIFLARLMSSTPLKWKCVIWMFFIKFFN